jgi:hypothetical protein
VVSAALIMGVVMPLSRTDNWSHYSRLGPFAEWQSKSRYLLRLVKGLAFLPLASWRSLMCAVPLVGLNLSVAFVRQFSGQRHDDDFASVFLLVAAMHGAVVVVRAVGSVFRGRRAIAAYAVMALVAVVLTRSVTSSVISYLYLAWPRDYHRQLHQELAYYRRLPIEIGIAAQSGLGPYLSARQRYLSIDPDFPRLDMQRLRPGDKVLISPNDYPELERLLEETAGLTRVHESPVLRVYEVEGDSSRLK